MNTYRFVAVPIRSLRALAVGLAVCLAAFGARGQSLELGLAAEIDTLIAAAGLEEADVSVHIVDLSTDRTLVTRQADRPMLPASTMKLLTSVSALHVLGAEYVYRTRFERIGDRLIIRGSGDPLLGDPALLRAQDPPASTDQLLDTLAEAIAADNDSPIREIVADDSVFDREWTHPTWDEEDLPRHYAAPVAGVNFHGNVFSVFARPSRDGNSPSISTEPDAAWLSVNVKARSRRDGGNTAWLARSPGANLFTLLGNVATRLSAPIRVTTIDNPVLFGQLVADRLVRTGVPVAGREKPSVDPPVGVRMGLTDTEANGSEQARVAVEVRTPLTDVLERCNRDSHNLSAEALMKTIANAVTGQPGTWADGAAVMRMLIRERLGPEFAASASIADGSGLSRSNMLAPSLVTAWLEDAYEDDSVRQPLLESLATPGSGTFTRRFNGLDIDALVYGKSGTLTGVRNVAGYVIHPVSGRCVVFCIFVSQRPGAAPVGRNGRDFADRVINAIDDWVLEEDGATAGR
ncbi:MAG: D-alanyl-D-alanine carboxypeptidase/D-alanyl-D-alanine-endopeptidase [Planctomycetota bacterium]